MTITDKEIELVQTTWKIIEPIAETAADLFYERLFKIAPEVVYLFIQDSKKQGRKLMNMLGFLVDGLSNLREIVHVVEDLGRRHVKYSVEERHYDKVGAALLWTLQQGLGVTFTDEVKAAWTRVYIIVSSTMMYAGKQTITPITN